MLLRFVTQPLQLSTRAPDYSQVNLLKIGRISTNSDIEEDHSTKQADFQPNLVQIKYISDQSLY